MLTLLTSILTAVLLAQPPDSIVLSGVVVDAAEKPLSDVDVVLWARILADGTAPTLARTTTDSQAHSASRSPFHRCRDWRRVGLSLLTNRAGQSPFERSIWRVMGHGAGPTDSG